VEAATKGALKIKVHSAGSLIKHPEIKSAVRRGLAPIGEVLMSRLSNEDPVFGVDSIPFLATNYDEAKKLWAASKPVIAKKLEAQGLKLLYAVPWPPQGIYAKKELKKVSDMKGLKMRAYNAATETLAKLAGAVPTQVEAPDIPTAFSTGRVDAMITSPSTGANSKAWDFVKYFHHTQAWLPKNMVIVNAKAFAKLPADAQKAVMDAAAKAEERGWKASMKETQDKMAVLKKNGMVIVTPTAELMNGLKEIGKKMTADWAAKAGADGKAILNAYK
jgi:TRAP-type C4-dicarboxylate transport system substrate-binding protein